MTKHTPSTLEKIIFKKMCIEAANGISLQCAREYWGDTNLKPRETELFKLNKNEINLLPTKNLETNIYLAKFGYLASLPAAHSNRMFKGKRIREDLMFTEECDSHMEKQKKHKRIFDQLIDMEKRWTDLQKRRYAFTSGNFFKFERKNKSIYSRNIAKM